MDLLKAIFDVSDDSETEEEPKNEKQSILNNKPQHDDLLARFAKASSATITVQEKVMTVVELVESDEEIEFGPKPPPNNTSVDESVNGKFLWKLHKNF
jgi:hypothetical protein